MNKKKLVIIVVPVLLVGGFLGKTMLLGGAKPAAAAGGPHAPAPSPVPGGIVRLDPITVNLAGGHYLRLGLGLQLTVKGDPKTLDGAKALDAAISTLSGTSVTTIVSGPGRAKAKADLLAALKKAYPDEVMDVYFTDYVTQ